MYFSLILFLSILIISFICSKSNIFSPSVLTSGIWFVVILLYILFGGELNKLTDKFLTAISIWVTLFCISSLFAQSLAQKKREITEPSPLARNILYYFSLLTFPLLILEAYKIISLGASTNWMSDLRMASIGALKEINIEDTNPFYVVVWLVSYFIELMFYSNKNKKRVYILFFMYAAFGFFSMGKLHFLILFLGTIFILYSKKIIRIKHVFFGGILLLFIFFSIQSLRSRTNVNVHKNKLLELYILSPAPAFETIKPNTTKQSGENVFRIFYAIQYKLGLTKTKPIDPLLNFTYVGVGTNTYTVLYPFYKDFGLTGIGIFAIILGLLFGGIFKKVENGDILYIIIYSLFLYEIIMQYGAEMFFTNLSLNLKRIIIAILPFLITKYELFSLKKRLNEKE